MYWKKIILSLLLLLLAVNNVLAKTNCNPNAHLSLQILGSGGPVADDARGSSAYLVWIQGKPRVLVDAGSGTFSSFGKYKINFADLNLIAISHFHTDHSADLPALLKSAFFSDRKAPFTISGPSGNRYFPSLKQYLHALFADKTGAYGYLSGYLDGKQMPFVLKPVTVNVEKKQPTLVYKQDGLKVMALGVPHAGAPTLAYKIKVKNETIVFASDQSGQSTNFIPFVKNADVLIMHLAVPEHVGRFLKNLHVTPSQIGKVAAKGKVHTLILSHFMKRSLQTLDNNLKLIRKFYHGNIILAKDGQCVEIKMRGLDSRFRGNDESPGK